MGGAPFSSFLSFPLLPHLWPRLPVPFRPHLCSCIALQQGHSAHRLSHPAHPPGFSCILIILVAAFSPITASCAIPATSFPLSCFKSMVRSLLVSPSPPPGLCSRRVCLLVPHLFSSFERRSQASFVPSRHRCQACTIFRRAFRAFRSLPKDMPRRVCTVGCGGRTLLAMADPACACATACLSIPTKQHLACLPRFPRLSFVTCHPCCGLSSAGVHLQAVICGCGP